MAICKHWGCLERELRLLEDMEYTAWRHAGPDFTKYLEYVADLADWLVAQPSVLRKGES